MHAFSLASARPQAGCFTKKKTSIRERNNIVVSVLNVGLLVATDRPQEQGQPRGLPELREGRKGEGPDRPGCADGLLEPFPRLRTGQAHEGRAGGRYEGLGEKEMRRDKKHKTQRQIDRHEQVDIHGQMGREEDMG